MSTFQFRFDKNSMRTRVVNDLIDGSPAAMGGLRNGDEIVKASRNRSCIEISIPQ